MSLISDPNLFMIHYLISKMKIKIKKGYKIKKIGLQALTIFNLTIA